MVCQSRALCQHHRTDHPTTRPDPLTAQVNRPFVPSSRRRVLTEQAATVAGTSQPTYHHPVRSHLRTPPPHLRPAPRPPALTGRSAPRPARRPPRSHPTTRTTPRHPPCRITTSLVHAVTHAPGG